MKRIMMTFCATALASFAVFAEADKSALAAARAQIDKVIATPAEMTSVMKGLSVEEQKQFLSDVNRAIASMPGSDEERAAKFLNVNHAALKGAKKGNLATLIAEVFATVPPEALTVISERFASDVLNRSADPQVTYTDAQFTEIALGLMAKINERVADTDIASPRSAFAIIMLVRASNGSPADLTEKLIATLPEDAQEMAAKEWIPAALGKDGDDRGYEPLLASADAGRRPDLSFVLVVAGPQFVDAMLFDLLGKNTDPKSFSSTHAPMYDAIINPLKHQIPTMGGDLQSSGIVAPQKGGDMEKKGDEPGPYQWQRLY